MESPRTPGVAEVTSPASRCGLRGKWILAIAALIPIAGLAIILWGPALREDYYILRLKTSKDWPSIVEKLSDLKSRKAILYFFGILAEKNSDYDTKAGCGHSLAMMARRIGEAEFKGLCDDILVDPKIDLEIKKCMVDELPALFPR